MARAVEASRGDERSADVMGRLPEALVPCTLPPSPQHPFPYPPSTHRYLYGVPSSRSLILPLPLQTERTTLQQHRRLGSAGDPTALGMGLGLGTGGGVGLAAGSPLRAIACRKASAGAHGPGGGDAAANGAAAAAAAAGVTLLSTGSPRMWVLGMLETGSTESCKRAGTLSLLDAN